MWASAGSDGLVPVVRVRIDLSRRQVHHVLRVPGRQPRPWPWLTGGQWTNSAERVDQQRKPGPPDAVLLSVLDPGDHGLIDTGICLEIALRPTQRQAASFDLGPDQVEPVLFLRITLSIEPGHGPSLATTTQLADIQRSPATYLSRRYAVHRHQQGRSRQRARIKHQAWVQGARSPEGLAAGAPGPWGRPAGGQRAPSVVASNR